MENLDGLWKLLTFYYEIIDGNIVLLTIKCDKKIMHIMPKIKFLLPF